MELVVYFNFYSEDKPSRHMSFYTTNLSFASGNLEDHMEKYWGEMEQVYGPHCVSQSYLRSGAPLNIVGFDLYNMESQAHQDQLMSSWRDMLTNLSPACCVGKIAKFVVHENLTDAQIFEQTKHTHEQLHDTSALGKTW